VVRPIVPVAEIVILFPPVRPRFVLAVLVFTRSDRLFAARSAPAVEVIYPTLFVNWEMEEVANPIVPEFEIESPNPRLKVDDWVPPIFTDDVVM
jgi:hypothetical protein